MAVSKINNDLQDQINDLNSNITKNKKGTTVNLNSYTSTMYTFPSDGYITCVGNYGIEATAMAEVYDSTGNNRLFYLGDSKQGSYSVYTTFVRKGMKCTHVSISDNGNVYFIPLIS